MPRGRNFGTDIALFEAEINGPFFEVNPIPMWIFDRESFRFLAVNEAAIRKYGYSRTEFLKMSVAEIRPAEDVARFFKAASSMKESIFQSMGEWRHRLKDGSTIDVEIHVAAVRFKDREAGLSFIHDVTERKSVESALRQTLERHEAIFQGSRDAVFISDGQSRFVSVNDAACELTGYSRSELLNMTIPDLHEGVDLAAHTTFHDKIMSGEPALTEALMLRKDGSKIHVEFNNRRIVLNDTPYMHTTARDITLRKKAEEDLNLYGLLFRNLTEMILFIRESDRRIIEANEAAQKAFGYTREEMLSMTVYDLLVPENRESTQVMFSSPDVVDTTIETVNRRKEGTTFHSEVRQRRLNFAGENIIVGIGTDLTERKRAEAALRQSEARHTELIESMPDGYYLSTSAGRFMEVNPAFCKMLGYTRDEMLAMNIPETLYFEASERQGETRYSGFSPVTEVYRLKHKDGSEVWFEDYARYIRDVNGKIIYHEGICRDVTERKRAQEALRFSESRLRTVIENSSDTIIFLDKDGTQTECLNPVSFERITGYTASEQLRKSAFDMIHLDDLPEARRKFPTAGRLGEVVRSELRIVRKNGTVKWVEATARNMLFDSSIRAMVINIRDIDERKSAERLLRESEERYRSLVDNSPDSIIVITDGNFSYVNPATLEPMGATSTEELVGKPVSNFIHPESRTLVRSRISSMLTTQTAMPPQEIKLLSLNGTIVEVEVRSAPVIYLGKPSIQSVIRNISARRQVEKQLQLQSVALNTAANGIIITDKKGDIVWANPAFESLSGYMIAEALGKNPRDLIKSGKQDNDFYKQMWTSISAGRVWQGEIVNRRKDGTLYTEEMTIAPVRGDDGQISHFVAVKQDVTERKALQEQLLQSQKLESIGQLAGGVAHDYNNILGVILGYAELLKSKLTDNYEALKPVDAILTAASRGADLTRQLLAFARKEMISPKVININTSIESLEKMLRRIIGENIKLTFRPRMDLWNIRIDPSQLDQILVNLAANSRDAIRGVGTITITTSNASIDRESPRPHANLMPGEYVKISFSDTGMGMDEETIRRIFEPFFTTKEKGHGTGLGLSTVYGIVNQNNGKIYVTSSPGEGTTFEILLPRFYGNVEEKPENEPETSERGSETILVVEDQDDMLELTKISLVNYGYTVLTATGPGEALSLCESYPDAIHLLLTDVIMPEMSGRDLSERIKNLRPEIKTLYMSGYTADELDPQGILDESVEFIQKPFAPTKLAQKVGEVLNG